MMERVREASSRLLALMAAVAIAVGLAVSAAAMPSKAFADEAAVRATATGIMKFNWSIDGDEYSRGSCFLINPDHVLTAYHCTFFSQAELEQRGYTGTSQQELRDRMTYSVTIDRDVTVGATLVQSSEAQDWAVFKLNQKVNGYDPLTIRDSREVAAAETVYAAGYPANADLSVISTYTAEDITFKRGSVSKPEAIYQGNMEGDFVVNGYFIMTDCPISGGDSGGPMIDNDGNVIGVSVMGRTDGSFYYCVASNVITDVLDKIGIDWTSAVVNGTGKKSTSSSSTGGSSKSGSSSDSDGPFSLSFTGLNSALGTAKGYTDPSKYTDSSWAALSGAIAAAEGVQNLTLDDDMDEDEYKKKQEQIDDAANALSQAVSGLEQQQESGLPIGAIIGIIAAIVIIAIIVVVLVMRSRKKSDTPDIPTGGAPTPTGTPATGSTQPALRSGGAQTWQKPGGAAAGEEVNETTILDEEANDTVILFQAASGGSLTRMSTNEQIPINSAEFTIGRERSKVDYCLEGNTSISRVHVRFVVRDGKTYVVDNRAANGTYVNGVKLRPGEESPLKSGDIITLADEKFKYSA